jgi:hypothetical protein
MLLQLLFVLQSIFLALELGLFVRSNESGRSSSGTYACSRLNDTSSSRDTGYNGSLSCSGNRESISDLVSDMRLTVETVGLLEDFSRLYLLLVNLLLELTFVLTDFSVESA